jgi:diacylglycerol kinase (ATP)
MKRTKLIHNPGAGNEEHSKGELTQLLEENGFDCRYSSTKKDGWEKIEKDTELIVVAGGDGTVRKTVQMLLDRRLVDKKIPVGVLPMGTANNMFKSLYGQAERETLLKAYGDGRLLHLDIGRIWGLDEQEFFMESFGYGVFPKLIKEMRKKEGEAETPEAEIQLALNTMHDIVQEYEACDCKVEIDGVDHSGKYLMVEVMNIPSIGSNLVLAPDADPADGIMNIVLVPESRRDELAAYLQERAGGAETVFEYFCVRGKHVMIQSENTLCHVDDKLVKLEKGTRIETTMLPGVIDFLIPGAA